MDITSCGGAVKKLSVSVLCKLWSFYHIFMKPWNWCHFVRFKRYHQWQIVDTWAQNNCSIKENVCDLNNVCLWIFISLSRYVGILKHFAVRYDGTNFYLLEDKKRFPTLKQLMAFYIDQKIILPTKKTTSSTQSCDENVTMEYTQQPHQHSSEGSLISESINDTMVTITMWIPLGGAFKGHAPKPHPLLSS